MLELCGILMLSLGQEVDAACISASLFEIGSLSYPAWC